MMSVSIVSIYFSLFLINLSYQRALDVKEQLYKYGYLNSIDQIDSDALESALKDFQEFTGLAKTGQMDADTVEMMNSRRCGMPDKVQYIYNGRAWGKNRLTYKFRNWTSSFTESQLNNILDNVAESWVKNVNLKISKTQTDNADIDVYFSAQDGRSNVLGYAYYPSYGGDIYFDKAEDWTITNQREKTNFPAVLAHELGHALGLSHSSRRNSLMFPYYSSEIVLPTPIDNQNLRNLYGAKPMLDNDIICAKTSVDCVLRTNRDSHILIKGTQFWVLDDNGLYSGPFSLNTLYPGLPDKVDAGFSFEKTTYFFSGNLFYKFERDVQGYKKKLISAGFPQIPSNLDAAFFEPSSSSIYFFKGSKYYIINARKSKTEKIVVNEGKITDEWKGVLDDIEAATFLGNNVALLIKNSKCYRINLQSKSVQTEDCKTTFFKC